MEHKTNVSLGGGGWFLCALALLFIGLKLTGHIAWSWWWVLAPLWAGAALVCVALAVVLVVVVLFGGRRRLRPWR